MEEADMDVSFDFYWQTPHFFEPQELELGVVDSMYVPAQDSLSGLYSCNDDSSSPDGANSCSTATTATTATTASRTSKNIIMERDRRRRLNEKLYALRGVVPNITKMDKASIIRDAIAYIEKLQEQEQRMLAEISGLESGCIVNVKTENVVSVGEAEDDGVCVGFSQRKKMRREVSASSIDDALCSPSTPTHPVEILELQVSEVGEKMAVVSVRCAKTRDAMANMCRALESLRLKVITASVTTVAGGIVHTMFVEIEGMGGAETIKETARAALAQLDVTRSSLKSMSYQ